MMRNDGFLVMDTVKVVVYDMFIDLCFTVNEVVNGWLIRWLIMWPMLRVSYT